MEVFQIETYPMGENCYALVDDASNALIVDPGDQSERIIQWINDHQWQPQAILLTHAHVDHIGAVDAVRTTYGVEVYVHELEEAWLSNPQLNLSAYMPGRHVIQGAPDKLWKQMGDQEIGSFIFEIQHVPGHSPGSVIYIFKNEKVVICGDTVFSGSIGRTDFPGGSLDILLEGIQRHILTLPDDYVLYPGHGPSTNVLSERNHNPFLQ